MTRLRRTVRLVSAEHPAPAPRGSASAHEVAALDPLVRRVVRARVADSAVADDLVQETLVRVLAASDRIEPGTLEAYAVATARNVIASGWRQHDRQRRNQHRVVDLRPAPEPGEDLLVREEQEAMAQAVGRLSEPERRLLLAHEVSGQDTRSLAREMGSTAGAVAASLHRTRAKLRVEYLLAIDGREPPTERCRPVLLSLSSGDRRRQAEVHAWRHLLECEACAQLSEPLMLRSQRRDSQVRIPIRTDADIVVARQGVREAAARLGFSRTDLTLIATAVSEVARNIVRFASAGEVVVELLGPPRAGVCVVARDTGPGIPDVEQALQDGYSTYHGLGLGLPGARRLMDELVVVSELGVGTTVTMTKWLREG